MKEIERIDKIVKNVITGISLEYEKNRNIDISVIWPRIIDGDLRGKCYVLFEKDKNLYVKVESGCLLSILRLQKKQILSKLREAGFYYNDIKFLI
jgi:hypothetical protein